MKIKATSKHKKAIDNVVYLRPVRGKMPRAKDIRAHIDPEAIVKAIAPKRQ